MNEFSSKLWISFFFSEVTITFQLHQQVDLLLCSLSLCEIPAADATDQYIYKYKHRKLGLCLSVSMWVIEWNRTAAVSHFTQTAIKTRAENGRSKKPCRRRFETHWNVWLKDRSGARLINIRLCRAFLLLPPPNNKNHYGHFAAFHRTFVRTTRSRDVDFTHSSSPAAHVLSAVCFHSLFRTN